MKKEKLVKLVQEIAKERALSSKDDVESIQGKETLSDIADAWNQCRHSQT